MIRGLGVLGVPDYHLLLRYAVFERGVPAQVFVGEEEYAPATAEGPFNHGWSVSGGANNTDVSPAKRTEISRTGSCGGGGNRCRLAPRLRGQVITWMFTLLADRR